MPDIAPGARRRSSAAAAWPDDIRSDLTRRALLLLPVAAAVVTFGHARAASAGATLPAPDSLAEALALALRLRQPLVVMASLHGCPFCKIVRESYLVPLRATGQPVVQIDMQDARPVRDFKGAATTHGKLLRQWGVEVAPTVLFFGRGGREAAERLAGASIPDFYGAYLDQRLATARATLG